MSNHRASVPRRRSIDGFLAFRIAVSAAAVLLLPAASGAGTIVVEGGCTLPHAIVAANTDGSSGGCPAGSGADTIVSDGTVWLTSVAQTVDGPNGLPSVTSTITIDGRSEGSIRREDISSVPDFRIFHVAADGNLTLQGVIVLQGVGVPDGGCVYNRGQFQMIDSQLDQCRADDDGGALLNLGVAEIINSSIWQSSANGGVGGGIANGDNDTDCPAATPCELSLVDSWIYANRADSVGGGIYNEDSADLDLLRSQLEANDSTTGGAIYNLGNLTAKRGIFFQNNIGNLEPMVGFGGAVMNQTDAYASFTNSIFIANIAGFGGGIFNKGEMDIESSTLWKNTAAIPGAYADLEMIDTATTRLERSIVGNRVGVDSCDTPITDLGYNRGCAGNPAVSGVATFIEWQGGRWVTVPLEAGSNAIDNGGTCSESVDSRGVARGNPCDIGAFEYGDCADAVLLNEIIDGVRIVESCDNVWIRSTTVEAGGHLSAAAGLQIALYKGFRVQAGGEVTLELDPTIPPDP